jgi:hypothetical protein
MQITPSNWTVADFCKALERKEITVNRNYQRSDKVWPPAAKSFLIETILLGYPIPKLYFHQVTDLKSRNTIKEVVDGQQRSEAIFEFYTNNLSISKKSEVEEAAGRKYKELPEDLQQKFLAYSLGVDIFVEATNDAIRETFRRINSYTIPLNPEEQRHARFQGEFKWFVYRLAKALDEKFLRMEVFNQKQIVRMMDAKLLAEVVHALINGIRTTNKRNLDKLYEDNDRQFDQQRDFRQRIEGAIDTLLVLEDIHSSALMRPYMMYSLILAIIHLQRAIPALNADYSQQGRWQLNTDIASTNLSKLGVAVEADEPEESLKEFVKASSERTNVLAQRQTRFRWFCRALQPTLL